MVIPIDPPEVNLGMEGNEVWVILYHGSIRNELVESMYFPSKDSAERVAKWVRRAKQCRPVEVEVCRLRGPGEFEAAVTKVHKRFGGAFKKLAEDD
jgi:hypothetical protein